MTVVIGVLIAYSVLGVVLYMAYFQMADQVYDRRMDEGRAALQFFFSSFVLAHLVASSFSLRYLIGRLRAPLIPTIVIAGVLIVPLVIWTLGMLSFVNACETGVSFPFPGSSC